MSEWMSSGHFIILVYELGEPPERFTRQHPLPSVYRGTCYYGANSVSGLWLMSVYPYFNVLTPSRSEASRGEFAPKKVRKKNNGLQKIKRIWMICTYSEPPEDINLQEKYNQGVMIETVPN